MKLLYITTGNVIHRQWITDHAVADAAHKAIVEAMAAYKEFSNDQEKVVSVDTGHGVASYRISQLIAVTCDDMDGAVEDAVNMAAWKKKVDDAALAAGVDPRHAGTL